MLYLVQRHIYLTPLVQLSAVRVRGRGIEADHPVKRVAFRLWETKIPCLKQLQTRFLVREARE